PDPAFAPHAAEAAWPDLPSLLALDTESFEERFRGRAIMRAKRDGMARNACIALGNTGTAADLPALLGAFDDASALVRGHAAWALAHLVTRLALDAAPVCATLLQRLEHESDPFVREEIDFALSALAVAEP